MKKFLLMMFALLVVGGAKVYAGLVPGNEFTSVAALDGKVFAIVNKAENKAICHKQKFSPFDLQYLPYADAFSSDAFGYLFKIESTEGGYIIRCVNSNGSVYDNDYFQSNKLETDNGVCFIFAQNFGGTNRGLDGDGYAVWDIQYDSEQAAFTLKNKGTDKYYNVPTQAANSDTPGYFTFCELVNENPIISIANTRTYSFDKALDFTGIEGLEAYVITAFNPTTATLTLSRVYQVPANTGLYLVGKDGDYEIPTIASAPAIATNLLHASSGTDNLEPTDGSNTNLIFGGTGADRGFHTLSAAGVMGANKAYLQIPTAEYNTAMSASTPLRFVFEDEDATGIAEVKTVEATDDAWYTLNGVKLNGQPTEKGIYILNGKKIVIK